MNWIRRLALKVFGGLYYAMSNSEEKIALAALLYCHADDTEQMLFRQLCGFVPSKDRGKT